jgi:putative hydrolase of the HAD superfamily
MIGNSLKSDILPFWLSEDMHIPFHTTWAHERIDHKIEHWKLQYEKLTDVLED